MATLRYELLGKKKSGSCSVVIIVTHKAVRRRIATNIELLPSEITKNGKITSFIKKRKIEDFLNRCREVLEKMAVERMGQSYSVDDIVSEIARSSHEDQQPEFFAFFDMWKDRTILKDKHNYLAMVNNLQKFCEGTPLLFSEITYQFLDEFHEFLKGKIGESTRTVYLTLLRRIYRQAMDYYNSDSCTVIREDPFIRYKIQTIKIKRGISRSITLDNLLKIYNYKVEDSACSTRMLGRDLFVLTFCLMGMNTADFYSAPYHPDNNKLCYQRQKTMSRREDGAYIEVDIQPMIKGLVDKYRDRTKKRYFNFYQRYSHKSSFIQAANIGLEKVCDELKIPKVTLYQARHTFATLSRNLMGFAKSDVDEALNHVGDYSVADIYIKKDFRIINENNKKLLNRVFNCSE